MKTNYTIPLIAAFLYFLGWSLRYFNPLSQTTKIVAGACIVAGLALFAYFIFTRINRATKPPTDEEKKDSKIQRQDEAEQKKKP